MARRRRRSTFRRRGGKPYGQEERERAAFEERLAVFGAHADRAAEHPLAGAIEQATAAVGAIVQGLVDFGEALERVNGQFGTYVPASIDVEVIGFDQPREPGIGLRMLPAPEDAR